MKAWFLALMLVSVPAMAQEIPAPTENGDQSSDPTPDSGPQPCHRCVGNGDGGWSDSDYSNPSGAFTLGDGSTGYMPGHSQDWYEGTGPWTPNGGCTEHCEVFTGRKVPGGNGNTAQRGSPMNEPGHGSSDGGRGHN